MWSLIKESSTGAGEHIQLLCFFVIPSLVSRYFGERRRLNMFSILSTFEKVGWLIPLGSNFWKAGNMIAYFEFTCRIRVENFLICMSTAVVCLALEFKAVFI